MKTEWDYTELADAYLERPTYAASVIDATLLIAGNERVYNVCDVGAGVAHLTLMWAERHLDIVAVEPNDAMRSLGIKRTSHFPKVKWHERTGEVTGQMSNTFDMVTFGSSFNVCDHGLALKESARILKPKGWFLCLWNNRDLNDPIQAQIENIIKAEVSDYSYGSRRQDQRAIIEQSGLFKLPLHLNNIIVHDQKIDLFVEAWRSLATLARQAGSRFHFVVDFVEEYLRSLHVDSIQIPYVTNVWLARLK